MGCVTDQHEAALEDLPCVNAGIMQSMQITSLGCYDTVPSGQL